MRRLNLDVVVGAALMLAATVFFAAAWRLPASVHEPIGSGTLPMAAASIVFCLALAMLRQALSQRAPPDGAQKADGDDAEVTAPMRALGVMLLFAGFVWLVGTRRVPFALLATAFLFLAVLVIAGFSRRRAALALPITAIIAVAIDYAFKSIVFVDLP